MQYVKSQGLTEEKLTRALFAEVWAGLRKPEDDSEVVSGVTVSPLPGGENSAVKLDEHCCCWRRAMRRQSQLQRDGAPDTPAGSRVREPRGQERVRNPLL